MRLGVRSAACGVRPLPAGGFRERPLVTPRTSRRAAGVVLFRGPAGDPRVLLLRNSREGHLGFAKGHLEEGEDELSGALREVLEETGLRPLVDPAFRDAIRYRVETEKRGAYDKEVVYFLGDVADAAPVVLSPEHDEARWETVPAALAAIPHASLTGVLRRAAAFRGERAARGPRPG